MDETQSRPQERLEELGAGLTQTKRGNIYTLTIIGQIEGHQAQPETIKTTKYEHVLPLLATIEESEDIDGLLLLLNTVGGDIEAGLAIAELIAGMRKPSVSLVLGGGHSIGIPLAVSAKKSMIVPTASMMIHPVRMSGVVVGAPATYHYFQRIQEQITDFVTANSRITREQFSDYMMATGQIATDVGTIVYGRARRRGDGCRARFPRCGRRASSPQVSCSSPGKASTSAALSPSVMAAWTYSPPPCVSGESANASCSTAACPLNETGSRPVSPATRP